MHGGQLTKLTAEEAVKDSSCSVDKHGHAGTTLNFRYSAWGGSIPEPNFTPSSPSEKSIADNSDGVSWSRYEV